MNDAPPNGPGAATLGAVAQVAALGPFFAFQVHPAEPAPRPPWRPMAELVDDPAVLAARTAEVRGYLAAAGGQRPEQVELRVAASVAHLGLVARLVSPALASAGLFGTVLAPELAQLRWQPVLGGGFPLSLPDSALQPQRERPAEQLAERLGGWLLDGPAAALVAATEPLGVSPHILWGNTASAVNGAAAALSATASAPVAARARRVAELLLRQPVLCGAGTPADGPGAGAGTGPGFRRRSCCLIYRAAPGRNGPLCGDCALTPRRATAR